MPTTLENIARERGWALNLGLQLRTDEGTKDAPNQNIATILREKGETETEAKKYAQWFSGLKVAEPKQLRKTPSRLTLPEHWLEYNRWGTFLRKGRDAGLAILHAPHLFLWNEFAAFSAQDFIFRHPKVGLAAPPADADWLKAVSVIWTSSITPYCLFLELSSGWGISRSTIDLGDVRHMPMPQLDTHIVSELASLHSQLAEEEFTLQDRGNWQRSLDERVASILSIPAQIMLLAREFSEFRLPLVKGKAPRTVTCTPDKKQLEKYAIRLKSELDGFMENMPRHHAVTLLNSAAGIIATIELKDTGNAAIATVLDAGEVERYNVRDILGAAEQKFGQWVYVQRSVRVFSGRKIHLCKPARRLEWTETQALLDAADIIAEVVESRGFR